ncbi:MAG: PrpF family protein [Rhodospirillaceae bacterium]|nr:PrpF family protein [Rhodospirillaceae bacterium]
MNQQRIPAVFIRGGTSKGVFFHERDLPKDQDARDRLFLDVIGAPDPYRRQLNGMGGGISSLNKVMIVDRSTRDDADVEYTFGQVAADRAEVDYSANCGNLSSAIGPFAIDEGLIKVEDGESLIRLYNTNTDKIVHARIPVRDGAAEITGDYELQGVAGTGAKLQLDYLNPGGAGTGKLLPSAHVLEDMEVDDHGTYTVSLVDAATPMVYVAAEALDMTATERPEAIDADKALKTRLEAIRRAGAIRMGLANRAEDVGFASPRIAVVAAPIEFTALNDEIIAPDTQDLTVRVISSGDAHRASPLTSAMCLAAACKIEGTLPHSLATKNASDVRIGNPSGVLSVGAEVIREDGEWTTLLTRSYRTQRRLMEGVVLVPA